MYVVCCSDSSSQSRIAVRGCLFTAEGVQVLNEKTALTRQSITMRVYEEEWGREASSPGTLTHTHTQPRRVSVCTHTHSHTHSPGTG